MQTHRCRRIGADDLQGRSCTPCDGTIIQPNLLQHLDVRVETGPPASVRALPNRTFIVNTSAPVPVLEPVTSRFGSLESAPLARPEARPAAQSVTMMLGFLGFGDRFVALNTLLSRSCSRERRLS